MTPNPYNWERVYSHFMDKHWIEKFENVEEFQATELQPDDYVPPEDEE